jgi:hypothetical protein
MISTESVCPELSGGFSYTQDEVSLLTLCGDSPTVERSRASFR